MQRPFDADVIVAGAGPAGAATAILLRQRGVRVLLLDWQSFPRDKVCGDFLSAVALSELQTLGIARQVQRQSNVIKHAGVWLDGRHLLTSPMPRTAEFPRFGCVIPRKVLDNLLLSKALTDGAQLAAGYRAIGYRTTPRHVEVDVQVAGQVRVLRAHALVGADGSTSVIARQLRGEPAIERDRVIAVRAYFDGVAGPADRADLYFSTAAFPGYAWLFPTAASSANVGVGMVLKTLPASEEHLPTLLQQLVRSDSALSARLIGATMSHKIVGWPLTTYNAALPVVADRVVLVGDAAGLINPLNGEGIQYALLSGRWAADTLAAGLAAGSVRRPALQPYAARIDTELRADLSLSRLVVDLIRNRALNVVWLEALETIVARAAADPAYAAVAGGVLSGVVPTRRLLELDIVRKTLAQAVLRTGRAAAATAVRRPSTLLDLAVRMTGAALTAATPMLKHPADTEQWVVGLGRAAALTAAAVTSARASGPPGRPTRGKEASRQEEPTWQPRDVRPEVRGRPASATRPRNRAAGAARAGGSGSRRSERPPRRS